jgi:membrane protein DedA with SNARE-associated domain
MHLGLITLAAAAAVLWGAGLWFFFGDQLKRLCRKLRRRGAKVYNLDEHRNKAA